MSTDTPQAFGAWSRAFAALYDRSLAKAEDAGMRDRRRAVLAQARGRVLEVGAGTGLNLPLYPDGLDTVTLTEPSPAMHRRLQARAVEHGSGAQVLCAGAQDLPFEDDAFDTVVSTLVLCTVPDQPVALREIARVLAPGGRLLFIEHVASDRPGVARAQRLLRRPWRAVADGCDCHRHTLDGLRATFARVEHEESEWKATPPLVRRIIVGTATI